MTKFKNECAGEQETVNEGTPRDLCDPVAQENYLLKRAKETVGFMEGSDYGPRPIAMQYLDAHQELFPDSRVQERESLRTRMQETVAKYEAWRKVPWWERGELGTEQLEELPDDMDLCGAESLTKALAGTMVPREVKNRTLKDGIYTVADSIQVKRVNTKKQVLAFLKIHPECCFASAYETDTVLALSERPEKMNTKGRVIGSGFNYGSTNFIKSNQNLLILAEND